MAGNSAETPRRRGPGRPFQPGQSGNPSGRPKKDQRAAAILKAATPAAAQTLVDIMQDEKAGVSARLQAASIVLDRVWGKATQPMVAEVTGHTDDNPATLEEMLAMAQEVIAGGAGGGAETPAGAEEGE